MIKIIPRLDWSRLSAITHQQIRIKCLKYLHLGDIIDIGKLNSKRVSYGIMKLVLFRM